MGISCGRFLDAVSVTMVFVVSFFAMIISGAASAARTGVGQAARRGQLALELRQGACLSWVSATPIGLVFVLQRELNFISSFSAQRMIPIEGFPERALFR